MAVTIDGTANTVTPLNGALGATTPSTVVATTVTDSTGTLRPLVSATAQASTSGTVIDFTGIPSWVKRITVMLAGVSTSGASPIIVQIGDSGGIENTGYAGTGSSIAGTVTSTVFTTGFGIGSNSNTTFIRNGFVTICFLGTNIWQASGIIGQSDQAQSQTTGGSKTLSDVLTQVRITTVNGTDTFDAGSINIMYE